MSAPRRAIALALAIALAAATAPAPANARPSVFGDAFASNRPSAKPSARPAATPSPSPRASARPAPTPRPSPAATPARAADDEPEEEGWSPRDISWMGLAPIGLTAGYVYAGRWERVVLVPIAVYGAMFAGALLGLSKAMDRASWKKPLEGFITILIFPALGAGAALGLSSVVVLVDQAFLPHAGAPFVAPAITLATLGLLVTAQVLLGDADTGPHLGYTDVRRALHSDASSLRAVLGPDHRAGLTFEERMRLVGGDDGAP